MVMARSSKSSALTPEPASNRSSAGSRERSTTTRTRGGHDMERWMTSGSSEIPDRFQAIWRMLSPGLNSRTE